MSISELLEQDIQGTGPNARGRAGETAVQRACLTVACVRRGELFPTRQEAHLLCIECIETC